MSTQVSAQAGFISKDGVTVCPLTGDKKGEAYRLPPHPSLDLLEMQFVSIVIHPNGQWAEWAPTG